MNYIEQLFFNEYAIKEFTLKIGETEISGKLKSLTSADHLILDDILAKVETVSELKITHVFLINLLSMSLLEIAGLKFKTPEEAKNFLESRPSILVEKLSTIYKKFEEELKNSISEEEIERNFSETPSTLKESKQS